jgi:hypothetical protein
LLKHQIDLIRSQGGVETASATTISDYLAWPLAALSLPSAFPKIVHEPIMDENLLLGVSFFYFIFILFYFILFYFILFYFINFLMEKQVFGFMTAGDLNICAGVCKRWLLLAEDDCISFFYIFLLFFLIFYIFIFFI